jgi:hypothetical protein
MHGGVYSQSPNFAWLIDAVRAFQNSKFDANAFVANLQRRSLVVAAQPMLDFLSEHFQLKLPKTFDSMSPIWRCLYEKEAKAIARSRQQRGVWGRGWLWLAELCRSRSWGYRVSYPSDWGVYARRSWMSILSPSSKEDVSYALEMWGGTSYLKVQIFRSSGSSKRMDFDLYHAKQWLSRIRLRSRVPGLHRTGGVWCVSLPLSQDIDLLNLRCEEAVSR